MRLPVSLTTSVVAIAVLGLFAGASAGAQDQPAPSQPAQQNPPAATTPAPTKAPQLDTNGNYIAVDPLAGVRYDNRYDLSVGMAYAHIKADRKSTRLNSSHLG